MLKKGTFLFYKEWPEPAPACLEAWGRFTAPFIKGRKREILLFPMF